MIKLKRLFFKLLRRTPLDMEVVQYWKTGEKVEAKVTTKDGVQIMWMEGEKYPFPGFPRGYLLFGKLSKLKHEVKNQIFNDNWARLENGEPIKIDMTEIYALLDEHRFDMIPPEKMSVPVREIYRAWTKVSPHTSYLRDLVTYILQEDDAYRWRLQWLVPYMPRWINPVKAFGKALVWLEHAEVIGDMKERIRLFRRIVLEILRDPLTQQRFKALFKEIDWKKVKLTKADKYFFRAKYFKVDLDKFDY